MDTLFIVATIAAIGIADVLMTFGLSVFEEFGKPREVICPENGEPATITADAAYAAMTSVVGNSRLELAGCSQWPERESCNRSCLSPPVIVRR
jgi:hypothetical protein